MLQKLNFKPGFNKMVTDSGAESQWVDGDFVRFRYGLPEKIGGWSQLTNDNNTLPGVARAQHAFTSIAGEKYVAIGTSQGLFLYYEGEFFDISPLDPMALLQEQRIHLQMVLQLLQLIKLVMGCWLEDMLHFLL